MCRGEKEGVFFPKVRVLLPKVRVFLAKVHVLLPKVHVFFSQVAGGSFGCCRQVFVCRVR